MFLKQLWSSCIELCKKKNVWNLKPWVNVILNGFYEVVITGIPYTKDNIIKWIFFEKFYSCPEKKRREKFLRIWTRGHTQMLFFSLFNFLLFWRASRVWLILEANYELNNLFIWMWSENISFDATNINGT